MSGVLYFGDPRGALNLLARGVKLAGVVHGRRGGPGWRELVPKLAGVHRWIRPDLDDPAVVTVLAAARPDLLVSCFYPRRIPRPVLDLAPGINVHPSDLPRWRGPDPSYWVIREGDPDTAICVHRLETGYDEGAVLIRVRYALEPRESGGHLAERMERLAAQHVADVAARLLRGEQIEAVPQAGEPTWAPLVDPDALEIDWHRPAEAVDRFVRAASPDPGAFTGIGDELLVIFSGAPAPAERFAVLPPGTTFVRDGCTFIRCADEAYRLGALRLGQKRMTGRDLARLLV